MKTQLIIVASAVLAVGCSAPPSKPPNGSPNNANSTTNNVNATTNNANISPNLNNRPFVSPDDFDRSCEWDSECELVAAGDVCGCIICQDAIASSAVEDFYAVVDALDCSQYEPVNCPAIACEAQIAVCDSAGTCNAITYREVHAEDFDQSCETADDCVLVPTGGICADCDCGRGAINVGDVEAYFDAMGNPDCNPGPFTCDCAPPDTAICAEGVCMASFGG